MIIQLVVALAPLSLIFFSIYLILSKSAIYGYFLLVLSSISLVLIAQPDLATVVANLVGVGRGADLLVYLLFVVVVFVLVGNLVRFRNHERLITQLARSITLYQSSTPEHLPKKSPGSF